VARDCGGPVTIDSKTGEITHGSVLDVDGTTATVLTNAAGDRKVLLRLRGAETEIRVPVDSVATSSSVPDP
jgi:hypothetical protein